MSWFFQEVRAWGLTLAQVTGLTLRLGGFGGLALAEMTGKGLGQCPSFFWALSGRLGGLDRESPRTVLGFFLWFFKGGRGGLGLW